VPADPPREALDPAGARPSDGGDRPAHREAADPSQTVEGESGGEGVAHHAVVTRSEDARRSAAAERRERLRDRVPRWRPSPERLDTTIAAGGRGCPPPIR
jgi:hypothetical protein